MWKKTEPLPQLNQADKQIQLVKVTILHMLRRRLQHSAGLQSCLGRFNQCCNGNLSEERGRARVQSQQLFRYWRLAISIRRQLVTEKKIAVRIDWGGQAGLCARHSNRNDGIRLSAVCVCIVCLYVWLRASVVCWAPGYFVACLIAGCLSACLGAWEGRCSAGGEGERLRPAAAPLGAELAYWERCIFAYSEE